MTKKEVSQLMTIMKRSYPNHFRKMDPKEIKETIEVWWSLFRDYPLKPVLDALQEYIMNNNSGFAPTPGQLNFYIQERVKQNFYSNKLDKHQAWELVLKTMRSHDFQYEAQEAFDSLPDEIQKCIGNSAQLRELAYTDVGSLEFRKRDFFERYDAYLDKQECQLKQTPNIAQLLNNGSLLQLESNQDIP